MVVEMNFQRSVGSDGGVEPAKIKKTDAAPPDKDFKGDQRLIKNTIDALSDVVTSI
jgi:hypothetical protein